MGSIIEIHILRALALHVLGDTAQAIEALERALVLAEPEGYVRIFVDEGPPMAHVLSTPLEEQGSVRPLARPKQALRNHVQQLLAAFDRPSPIRKGRAPERDIPGTARPLLDPLTERELEVLRLIAAGLSNREVAAELYLAINTVKWYVKSLYSKLGVESRTQAVARARSLHLLPD
jgi:LuxR family maltose regulon positive regulatory protein